VNEKAEARARVRAALAALSADERKERGASAIARLLELPELRVASDLLLFRSLADEVDTAPLFAAAAEAGQRTYAPRVAGERLEFVAVELASQWARGPYRTLEPKAGPALDFRDLASGLPVIVVPGVAFTAKGDRLGRGGGHYDRALAALRALTPIFAIGLALEAQIVAKLPVEPHDEPLDRIVTEERVAGDR
jgi:5-formyltetrahydrofolate cyclo-ligase